MTIADKFQKNTGVSGGKVWNPKGVLKPTVSSSISEKLTYNIVNSSSKFSLHILITSAFVLGGSTIFFNKDLGKIQPQVKDFFKAEVAYNNPWAALLILVMVLSLTIYIKKIRPPVLFIMALFLSGVIVLIPNMTLAIPNSAALSNNSSQIVTWLHDKQGLNSLTRITDTFYADLLEPNGVLLFDEKGKFYIVKFKEVDNKMSIVSKTSAEGKASLIKEL